MFRTIISPILRSTPEDGRNYLVGCLFHCKTVIVASSWLFISLQNRYSLHLVGCLFDCDIIVEQIYDASLSDERFRSYIVYRSRQRCPLCYVIVKWHFCLNNMYRRSKISAQMTSNFNAETAHNLYILFTVYSMSWNPMHGNSAFE